MSVFNDLMYDIDTELFAIESDLSFEDSNFLDLDIANEKFSISESFTKLKKTIANGCYKLANKCEQKERELKNKDSKFSSLFAKLKNGLRALASFCGKLTKKEQLAKAEKDYAELQDKYAKAKHLCEKQHQIVSRGIDNGDMTNDEIRKAYADRHKRVDTSDDKASESSLFIDDTLETSLAIESAYSAYAESMGIAYEGFLKHPKPVEKLLINFRKKVNKCKTVEACNDYAAKLKAEENKFNGAVKMLQGAAKKYSADQDKKNLKASVKPVLSDLKKTCNILKIGNFVDNTKNVTQDEIKNLHDFIVGAKQIINERIKVLKSSASESFIDDDFDFDDEFDFDDTDDALESLFGIF